MLSLSDYYFSQVNLIFSLAPAARTRRFWSARVRPVGSQRRPREKDAAREERKQEARSERRANQILLLSTDRMNRSIFHISLLAPFGRRERRSSSRQRLPFQAAGIDNGSTRGCRSCRRSGAATDNLAEISRRRRQLSVARPLACVPESERRARARERATGALGRRAKKVSR